MFNNGPELESIGLDSRDGNSGM